MEKNVQPSGGRLPFRTRLTREAHYAITEASQGEGISDREVLERCIRWYFRYGPGSEGPVTESGHPRQEAA